MTMVTRLQVPDGGHSRDWGSGWKKYDRYELDIAHDQDDKALEIRLCNFSRPHMRAFHCAWWSFFVAFVAWFSIAPLLPEIRNDLGISKKEVWTSSIAAVGCTIFVRLVVGPLCDVYGAKGSFCFMLCFAAIPTACTGLIQSATDLIILRSFVGVAGGTFVTCQFWTTRMFAKEVVGTANASKYKSSHPGLAWQYLIWCSLVS
jgi:MFS transporter, NNP family, nitrate/nitrite transporter